MPIGIIFRRFAAGFFLLENVQVFLEKIVHFAIRGIVTTASVLLLLLFLRFVHLFKLEIENIKVCSRKIKRNELWNLKTAQRTPAKTYQL
jgi:hypothetical protein